MDKPIDILNIPQTLSYSWMHQYLKFQIILLLLLSPQIPKASGARQGSISNFVSSSCTSCENQLVLVRLSCCLFSIMKNTNALQQFSLSVKRGTVLLNFFLTRLLHRIAFLLLLLKVTRYARQINTGHSLERQKSYAVTHS